MDHSQILPALRKSGAFSDLTVTCGPTTFKIHKCVMSLRSKWFAAACQERRWKEGDGQVIDLKAVETYGNNEDFSCDDPAAVAYMIDFVYCDDYNFASETVKASSSTSQAPASKEKASNSTPNWPSDGKENCPQADKQGNEMAQYLPPELWYQQENRRARERQRLRELLSQGERERESRDTRTAETKQLPATNSEGSLAMHARLYAMGVKYGIDDLKTLSVRKMQRELAGIYDREDFAKALFITFGATPDNDEGMRNTMIQKLLTSSAELVADPIVEQAVNAVEGLPFELFKRQSVGVKRRAYLM